MTPDTDAVLWIRDILTQMQAQLLRIEEQLGKKADHEYVMDLSRRLRVTEQTQAQRAELVAEFRKVQEDVAVLKSWRTRLGGMVGGLTFTVALIAASTRFWERF